MQNRQIGKRARAQWIVLGTVAFLLAVSGAAAQTPAPTKARLSIVSPNKSRVQYAGVLLPNGQTTNFIYGSYLLAVGVRLKLEVWFADGTGPIDKTGSAVFTCAPDLPFPFLGNAFILGAPGLTVDLTGRFTQAGKTVSSSLTIQEALFRAPHSYDGGRYQKQLSTSLDELSRAITSWATPSGLSAASQMPIWTNLDELRLFIRIWWSGKTVNPLVRLGNTLAGLGAPADLLIRLSRIASTMQTAGLIRIGSPRGDGSVEIESGPNPYPRWLPPGVPDIIIATSPPISVFWYGL